MDTTNETTNTPSTPSRSKWLIAALGALLLLGTTVGIVSAQEDDAGSGDAPSEEERDAYRECLEENGAQLPEPGERPDRDSLTDEDREAFREAREACADLHPKADEIEAFRECMAENGVELREPGEERPDPGDLTDEDREAFREAREACADEAPFGGRGPGCHRPGGPGRFGDRGPGAPGAEDGEDGPSLFEEDTEDALLGA